MNKTSLHRLVLLILFCFGSASPVALTADVNDPNDFRFLQEISSQNLLGSTVGWQNIVYSGSQVGTTEFLIVSFSHGNPACSQMNHIFNHAVQGGGWSKAVTAGNDDKSAEVWIRHVTASNQNSLGQIEASGAGAVHAGVLVYEGTAEVTNTASVTQCSTTTIAINSNGNAPYLVIAASDNGTAESANALFHFSPGDDRVFIYLTSDSTFVDSSTGTLRGAIASLSLADAGPPPLDPNDAQFVSQDIPLYLDPGETASVTIRMKNVGADTWSSAGAHKLGSQPGGDSTWGLTRYNIVNDVLPDEEVDFTFDITAPLSLGMYDFEWRMVDDAAPNQGWFGEVTPKLSIMVGPQPIRIEAESFDSAVGFGTQNTTDVGGGLNLKDAALGNTATYTNINIPISGYYEATFRIASLSRNILFDLKNGETTLVSVNQPTTGDFQTWTSWTTPEPNRFYLPAGTTTLTIEATDKAWNLNWFELNPVDAPEPPDPDRLNVVFLFADDLGYGDLAVYGHPYAITPNLDQLAADGTRFAHYYMTGNVCGPSRTGMMTSRHPDTFANDAATLGMHDRETVTDIFNDAGYATGHFGKWHLGPDDNPGDVVNGLYGIDEIINEGGSSSDPRGRDNEIYDNAIAFIENHQNEPFFVNVWGYSTHTPLAPHQDLVDLFSDVVVDRSLFGANMQARFDELIADGQDLDVAMRNYLADVHGLDFAVGRLLAKLDELGLRDNTIVVFASDNGAATDLDTDNMIGWSGGLKGAKHTNYDGGVKSQLLVRWPNNVPANTVNNVSVMSALDWLPTISSLAGIDIADEMFEGEDVSDIWLGSQRSRVNPMFWKFGGQTVVQGNWKLTSESGSPELFDLSVDEGETTDVSGIYPDVASKLSVILQQWRATIVENKNKDPNNIVFDPVQPAVIIGPADVPMTDRGGSVVIGEFTSAKVNFQKVSSTTPTGYVADVSLPYAARGNGFTYGWDSSFDKTRERTTDPDPRLNTFNHMQIDSADQYWEIKVPNGDYSVTIVGGDPDFDNSFIELVAEEGTANEVILASGAAAGVNFVGGSGNVTVADGRLTISNGPLAVNNKICYIDITKIVATDAYAEWKVTHSVNSDDGDEDGDGLSNFIEFAFDGDPNTADADSKRPVVVTNGANFDLTFHRGQSSITYTIEGSNDLSDWTVYNHTITNSDGAVGTDITITVPSSTMGGTGKLFLRLKLEN